MCGLRMQADSGAEGGLCMRRDDRHASCGGRRAEGGWQQADGTNALRRLDRLNWT